MNVPAATGLRAIPIALAALKHPKRMYAGGRRIRSAIVPPSSDPAEERIAPPSPVSQITVEDPETPRPRQAAARAFFGATVRYANAAGVERVVSIVGVDEVNLDRNHISWVSPLGRALMKSAAGDSVVLEAPRGTKSLTVLEVSFQRISVEPFREPAGSEASAKRPRPRQSV